MHKWQIILHENGGIGGKFDGNCYVNPNGRFSDSLLAIPVKVRFKHNNEGAAEQYLWGGMYYGLKIINTADCYNLQLEIAGNEYLISDFALHYDDTYNIESFVSNSEFTCLIKDKWNNLRYKHTCSVSTTSFGNSIFYIGAERQSNASASGFFNGVIFAFQYFDSITNEYVKLIFRKNYLNVPDYVIKDHFGNKNASLYNIAPAAFWSESIDISDYSVSISKLRYRADEYHIPLIQRTAVTMRNNANLQIDDIISIQDILTGNIHYIYRVKSIKSVEYNLNEIALEDVYGDLSDIYFRNIIHSTTSFTELRYDWWNTVDPVLFISNYHITEYFHDPFNPDYCWMSLIYLLKMLHGVLELDYIIDLDTSELNNGTSYLKQDSTSINYREIAFNLYVLKCIGKNKEGECQVNVLSIFRALLNTMRITTRISNSHFIYEDINNDNIMFPEDNRKTYETTISEGPSSHFLQCTRLASSQNCWDDVIDWSDTLTEEFYELPSDEMLKNSFKKVSLPDHFNLGIHGSYNNHFATVSPPVEEQLTIKLNTLYTGKKKKLIILTAITKNI